MTLARLFALGGISITTLGCAAFNYAEPDGPIAELSAAPIHPRPEVALVLGSGGPRAYARGLVCSAGGDHDQAARQSLDSADAQTRIHVVLQPLRANPVSVCKQRRVEQGQGSATAGDSFTLGDTLPLAQNAPVSEPTMEPTTRP